MPRILFFLFFLVSCLISHAQQIDGMYSLFKKDGSRARNIDQAIFFVHQTKESDTLYVRRLYNKSGPMIKWESYKDPSCEIPNGIFAWYNEKGTIDSSCRIVNGMVTEIIKTDPMAADNSSNKTLSVVQLPAEFDGGLKAWNAYLTKTLEIPDRFTRLSKNGTKTTVGVSFSIGVDGGIYDILIEKSSEWSVDMESIRVVKNSPHWKPAVQNGKTVIDRHKQNLTYAVN